MADPGPKPLTTRSIVLGGLAVLAVGAGMLTLLLTLYGGGSPQDQAHLDAVRTADTIVVGTGGAVALLLAARRQRSAELTLVHQQEIARHAEYDAIERRITELYTKAADQLGSDKAPVRLAGLYALERLGVTNTDHRQTIVNVICAYLRMPYENDREEGQVRVTALRILQRTDAVTSTRGACRSTWTTPTRPDPGCRARSSPGRASSALTSAVSTSPAATCPTPT